MLTIDELLSDPTYKQFVLTVPKLPAVYTAERRPWRLFVMLKGEHHWRSRRFGTYKEMVIYYKKLRPRVHDAAFNCPAIAFPPPQKVVKIKGQYFTTPKGKKIQKTKFITWKPVIPADEFEDHHWCGYCRRPTTFKRFDTHHALRGAKTGHIGIDPTLLRCSICGASENIVNIRKAS